MLFAFKVGLRMATPSLLCRLCLAASIGLVVGCAKQPPPTLRKKSTSSGQSSVAKSSSHRELAVPEMTASAELPTPVPNGAQDDRQSNKEPDATAGAANRESTSGNDAQPAETTLADATARFSRARKAVRDGNAAAGLKLATECWNESRSHKGNTQWDEFGATVFKELASMEKAAASPERADPTDSTTLILK